MKERFFFKYCRNGHMLYTRGQEIEVEYCKTCGEKFLDQCDKCSSPLANSFTSIYFPSLNKPASFPKNLVFVKIVADNTLGQQKNIIKLKIQVYG